MTSPVDERSAPPEPKWEPVPEQVEYRSEPPTVASDAGERGRPVGHWLAGGGTGAAGVGEALWHVGGPVGLAAGAVTAAGGAVAYGTYRLRNRNGFRTTRTRTRRTTTRSGSVGKGRAPKLGGGRGPKMFGGRGGGLGKGKAGKVGGGKGPKLGKGGGRLLGGKGSKLTGGKHAKFGGGRGSGLGGKLGRLGGKAGRLGGRASSRLGSTGHGGKSRGGVFRRGGKAGLGFGARGGKLLGGKSRAGLGRWSKSTGAGAGVLGSKFGRGSKRLGGKAMNSRFGRAARRLGGKAGAAALRTRAGRRATAGFKAAKAAMTGKSGTGSRWSRFQNRTRAARSAMGSSRNPFARWVASIAAAMVALTAMSHDKWKARQAAKDPQPATKQAGHGKAKAADPAKWDPSSGLSYREWSQREQKYRRYAELRRISGMPLTPAQVRNDVDVDGDKADELAKQFEERYLREHGTKHDLYPPGPATARPAPTGSTNTRRPMSGSGLPAIAAEMHAAAANYRPEGMLLIAHELDQFGDVPANVALAIRSYTMGMHGEKPINDAVIEKLQELAKGFADLTSLADEIGPLFRQVHADDLKRFEAPRVNEHEWDVSRNV